MTDCQSRGRRTTFFVSSAGRRCCAAQEFRAERQLCLAQIWHGCVPQVSKPAVSPASKPARCTSARRFGNLRHGRLGSLRYAQQIQSGSSTLPGWRRILSCAPKQKADTRESKGQSVRVCHYVSLCETSPSAFGGGTKWRTGTRIALRKLSPCLVSHFCFLLFTANQTRKAKDNSGKNYG
jgi:hypothetical protein